MVGIRSITHNCIARTPVDTYHQPFGEITCQYWFIFCLFFGLFLPVVLDSALPLVVDLCLDIGLWFWFKCLPVLRLPGVEFCLFLV